MAGIVDVGGHRRRLIERPERTGNETAAAVLFKGQLGGLSSEARTFDVELIGERLHTVVGHNNGRTGKGVCLDHVGASEEVLEVDGADGVGLGQVEQVVIAAHIAGPIGKAGAAVPGLVKLQPLDHRAHRPVEDEDALAGGLFEGGKHLATIGQGGGRRGDVIHRFVSRGNGLQGYKDFFI